MSCIEWTTNPQGQLQSVGVPGVPLWQSQSLAEQKRLASEGSLGASPGSVVDAQADKLAVVQSEADWLAEVNRWRTEAGVQPIGENVGLSLGATEHARYLQSMLVIYRACSLFTEHARYLVKNGPKAASVFISYTQTIDGAAHTEDEDNPDYTHEGYEAARTGEVGFECNPTKLVDGLVEAPFHRLSILAPWMRVAGYGDYGRCPVHAATLVLRGSTPVGLTKAVLFPPDNGMVDGVMRNSEWPNPLAACPGYSFPVGTPITVQMGAFVKVQLESSAIQDETDGRQVEECGFDASTYPLEYGRRVLTNYGAIVVIPRNPLTPGHTYRINVRTHRHAETWNFHVRSDHAASASL